MNESQAIVDMLAKSGPWGLLFVSGLVIKYLFAEIQKRDKEHAEKTQLLNDRIVAAVEKQISLIQSLTKILDKDDER